MINPHPLPLPNLGTLVARDLAAYREAVAIAAAFPIEINDAKALKKQLRFFGPGDPIPELEPACLVPMAQALEDVRAERRARNVAVARASARAQFWRQGGAKRRRAGGAE